ncbi:exopolysaccharide biosynthesis protein [Chelativorans sp. YIM 93263]|uniref:exopolysaccharide biosynthesis protein n=1 Tax=Chelativorans sp. YIM 93263 TaxID=2906648 RepID=UPI002379AAD2|nr:exopolysaccharide biosynthesis protein [Chelativorans sp. YIM 93263]
MGDQRAQPESLGQLLDRLAEADGSGGNVSVDNLLDEVGHRSFGPLLLVLALVAFTPLGGIPGIPTVLAGTTILIAAQLVIGRNRFWIPGFVVRRSIDQGKLKTTIGYVRPVARFVDKLINPRLSWLTRPPFLRPAAAICIIVALTIPPLEVVPFGGTISWAAIAAFGLALIAHDGVLTLIAAAFAGGAAYVIATTLL